MTLEDAEEQVEAIRALALGGDDEAAHSADDTLRDAVLLAIASGHPNPVGLATVAIKTNAIGFGRWTA